MAAEQEKRLSHKEQLLRQGTKHFYAYGFHGTTVDAILAAAGVPKGSFYHHFGSKEAFAHEVLERYFELQRGMLDRWKSTADLSAAGRLVGYFTEMVEYFVGSDYQRACLAGKFSTEVAATNEAFREQLDKNLRTWKDEIAALLQAGQDNGDTRRDRSADDLADGVLALIQGAFVVALSSRDSQALQAIATTIPLMVDSPAP